MYFMYTVIEFMGVLRVSPPVPLIVTPSDCLVLTLLVHFSQFENYVFIEFVHTTHSRERNTQMNLYLRKKSKEDD